MVVLSNSAFASHSSLPGVGSDLPKMGTPKGRFGMLLEPELPLVGSSGVEASHVELSNVS